MNLFQVGDFTLHSGQRSEWKIDCDALTDADWEGLARIASEILSPFRFVEGIPRGGMKFARALYPYRSREMGGLLLADDVLTSGESMEQARTFRGYPEAETAGVAAFARGPVPNWVTPLFLTKSAIESLAEQNEDRVRRHARRADAAGNSCPCRWTTPCADRCSCATPASSSGCLRCCRYGSDDQRRERAQAIVAGEKALQRIATFGNHLGPSDEAVIARAAKATSVTAVNAEERCAACGSPNVVFESPAEGYSKGVDTGRHGKKPDIST